MKTIQLKIEVDGTEKIIDDLGEIEKELLSIQKTSKKFDGSGIKDLGNDADTAAGKVKKLGNDVVDVGDKVGQSEQNLIKLSSGAKVLAGGIDIASAAISSLGVENEDTEKQILKLQQTLTLTRGLVDFTEGLDELGIGLKTTAKTTGDLDKANKITGKGFEDTGKKTGGLSKGLKGLGDVVKANPILTLAGIFLGLLAATGKLDDLIKILGDTFGQVFDALQPVLDILTDVLTKALDPLLKVLGPVLVPVLKLVLIPTQLLGAAFEFLSPLIIAIGEGVALLASLFGELADAAVNVIGGVFEFLGISKEQEVQNKKVEISADNLSKAYEKQKEVQDRLNQTTQYDIDLKKAQGASIRQIEELELKLAKTRAETAAANADQTIRDAEAQKLIAGKTKEELAALDAIIQGANDDKIAAQRQFNLLEAKINKDRNDRTKESQKKANEDAKKARSDAEKQALEDLKNSLANQARESELGYEERKTALINGYIEEGATIKEQEQGLAAFEREESAKRLQDRLDFLTKFKDEELKKRKLNAKERVSLEKDLENEISKLQVEQAQATLAEQKRLQGIELSETTAFYQELANARNLAFSTENLKLTQDYNNEIKALNDAFRNGEITSEEEYNEKLVDIDNKYDDIRRGNDLKFLQQQVTDAENQQQELLNGLEVGSEEYQKVIDDTNADILAKKQAVSDKELEITQDTSDEILDIKRKEQELIQNQIQATANSLDVFSASLANLAQDASENFDSLGFDIVNAFSNVSAGASELFNTLSADVQDLGPNIDASTEKTASNATKLAAAFGAVGAALGEVGAVLQKQTEQRLADLEAETELANTELEQQSEDRITAIEAQVEAGVITEEQGNIAKEDSAKVLSDGLQELEDARLVKETALKRKSFQQEKSIRIAQAIAQGAQAALAGYASGLAIPVIGPGVGAAYAAVAAAITAVQVGIISKQQFPEPGTTSSGGGGGGSVAIPTPSIPLAAQGGSNFQDDVFNTGVSQESTLSRVRPPVIRAYVTESDITSTQQRVDRIQNQSEL
jgi:hypothetical protein